MLELLVDNKLSTSFIVIEDSADAKGDDLLLSFLVHHAQDSSTKEITFLHFENPASYYSDKYKDSKINFADCFTELSNWQPNVSADVENQVVFIDSLSIIILLHGFKDIYKYLFDLSKKAKKIILLVHGDVFSDKEKLSHLNFLATTVVKINKSLESKSVEIVHKKLGGKVIKSEEEYVISSEFNLSTKVISPKKKERIIASGNVKDEIKNIATFDIGLDMRESEKAAKSKLVLPYMRNETEESGKIIYEADAGDDLEEDPDDDLDI